MEKWQGVATFTVDAVPMFTPVRGFSVSDFRTLVHYPIKLAGQKSSSLRPLTFCTHRHKEEYWRAIQFSGMMQFESFHQSISMTNTVMPSK
jgi:hypothetical protein